MYGGDFLVARQHRQAGDVIGMLVGDEDGVEVFQVLADGREALAELLHAQAGVHQDARLVGGQQARRCRNCRWPARRT
jgi:hypothetical protein